MYDKNESICDDCGKPFDANNLSLKDHIMHMINPMYYWSCTACLVELHRRGGIIAGDIKALYEDYEKERQQKES